MRYILLVYNRSAYAEYPLLCQEQGEWALPLERTRFALPDELRLAIGYQNGRLCFLSGPYSLRSQDGKREFPLPAEVGKLYFLSPSFGGHFILAIRRAGADLPPALRAYRLNGETRIGSLPENHLIYNGFRAVSGIHAVVLPDAAGHRLEDRSNNGTYINQERITAPRSLMPGDRIHIFGLDILYMDGCIVLDASTPGLQISESLAASETGLPESGPEDETVWEGPPDAEAETVFESALDGGEETIFDGAAEDETVFVGTSDGEYQPNPVDTSGVLLPEGLEELVEQLAQNVHENWAKGRLEEGWVYGPVRDDIRRTTPCLVPYKELSEEERNYDRRTALETVRQILKLGYTIRPKEVS